MQSTGKIDCWNVDYYRMWVWFRLDSLHAVCCWCSMEANWGFTLYVSGVTCHMIDETAGVQGPQSIAPLYHFVSCSPHFNPPPPPPPTKPVHTHTKMPYSLCLTFAHLLSRNTSFSTLQKTAVSWDQTGRVHSVFRGIHAFAKYLINTYSPSFFFFMPQQNEFVFTVSFAFHCNNYFYYNSFSP